MIRIELLAPHFRKVHVELPGEEPITLHGITFAEPWALPHDHPWGFTSEVKEGSYVEEVFALDGSSYLQRRQKGDIFRVEANHIHRIVELPEGECWTRVWPGPHERTWGFYEWKGGRPWVGGRPFRRNHDGEWYEMEMNP